MQVHHLGVKFAFLHGEIKEDIYVEQSPGFEEPRKEDLLCKLQNSTVSVVKARNKNLKF